MLIESLLKAPESIYEIGLLLFLLCFLIQLYYYLNYFIRLSFHQTDQKKEIAEGQKDGVSVIIAFKNEVENLSRNLPFLLEQDYPNFEIILVNDHSKDDSVDYLQSHSDSRIKLVDLEVGKGKKAAIQRGILQAKFEWLLFTDADCKPMSKNWISLMFTAQEKETEIIIGYGRFYRRFSLVNLLQRFENAVNSLQNMSFCLKSKRAYMAVGRNLMYRKEIANHQSSIENGDQILSGDDDLIVNRLSKAGNTTINYRLEAQTVSEASPNWTAYFYQKRRQLEAGKQYRSTDRFKLGILGLAQLLFNLLLVTFLVSGYVHPLILVIFVIKFGIQLFIYYKPFRKFGEFDLWLIAPLLEMIYLPIISLIGLSLYLWKVDRWK